MALSEKLRTYVTPEERAAIEALAKAEDRSVAAIVRRAIRLLLNEAKA